MYLFSIMYYDDNAEYRQKEIFKLRDWSQEDPHDTEAARAGPIGL